MSVKPRFLSATRTRDRGRRFHMGTCERCGKRTHTARFKDDGTMFRRLGDEDPGGHWLCQTCVIELGHGRPVKAL